MTAIEIAIASVVVSFFAFVISSISLWKTHFAKPKPIIATGHLRHRIYPIVNEGKTWYLTSFDLPISFLNGGAQPMLIESIQLKMHFRKLPIPNNYEILPFKWEIQLDDANRINSQRFSWLNEIAPKDAMAFSVLPKQTVVKHFIFEARWDEPVVQDEIDLSLEIYAPDNKRWECFAKWTLCMAKQCWVHLAKKGSCYTYGPESVHDRVDLVFPADLHKYTGTKEQLPEITDAPPSYLNYDKK